MRKILIPTDYCVESLELVEYAILNYPNERLEIILVAGYSLPDSRWASTHFNAREQVRKQIDFSFVEAKRRLFLEHKNHIGKMSYELFTGVNSFAFQNFLEHLDAVDAIIPSDKSLHCSESRWFDTTKFLAQCVKNVIKVPVQRMEEVPQKKFSLMSLFNL